MCDATAIDDISSHTQNSKNNSQFGEYALQFLMRNKESRNFRTRISSQGKTDKENKELTSIKRIF